MPLVAERDVRGGLVVEGYRDLQKAFAKADKAASRELRRSLKDIARPVSERAEALAVQEVKNIGDRWSKTRIGATRSLLYVAPKERGVSSRARRPLARPNLKTKLLDEAYYPALDQNEHVIREATRDLLSTIGREWEE